jgi:hypothetical protein
LWQGRSCIGNDVKRGRDAQVKAGNDILERYLKKSAQSSDTSLRANALRRALGDAIPKTLTPYEWEEWYAEHGVPEGHKAKGSPAGTWCAIWKRWFAAAKGNDA